MREGKKARIGETVAVIGDGTAAFDAARTARRLGAKAVTVLASHEAEHIRPAPATSPPPSRRA